MRVKLLSCLLSFLELLLLFFVHCHLEDKVKVKSHSKTMQVNPRTFFNTAALKARRRRRFLAEMDSEYLGAADTSDLTEPSIRLVGAVSNAFLIKIFSISSGLGRVVFGFS